jgi:hypothetical protein
MSTRQFIGTRALTRDDADAMNKAFAAALKKLGLNNFKDPTTEIIAQRIVNAALDGERDPIRLTEIGAGGRD